VVIRDPLVRYSGAVSATSWQLALHLKVTRRSTFKGKTFPSSRTEIGKTQLISGFKGRVLLKTQISSQARQDS
jgi:hypothetical protein